MINYSDVMPIPYLKKEAFSGSYQGMRYRMKKKEITSETNPEEKTTYLSVHIWPQPFCFDKTEDSEKTEKLFEFTPTGIDEAVDWLNQKYIEEKKRWTKE